MAAKTSKFKFSFFELALAFWFLIVFFSLLTALAGIFYSGLILFLAVISWGGWLYFFTKERSQNQKTFQR